MRRALLIQQTGGTLTNSLSDRFVFIIIDIGKQQVGRFVKVSRSEAGNEYGVLESEAGSPLSAYLKATMQGVESQTNSNIVHVVLDNCSRNCTASIIEQFGKQRIKVLKAMLTVSEDRDALRTFHGSLSCSPKAHCRVANSRIQKCFEDNARISRS